MKIQSFMASLHIPPWDLLEKISPVEAEFERYFESELVYEAEAAKEIKDDKAKLSALQDMYDTSTLKLEEFKEAYWQSVGDIDTWILENKPDENSTEIYLALKDLLDDDLNKFSAISKKVFASINQLKARIKITEKYAPNKAESKSEEEEDVKSAFSKLFLFPGIEKVFISILKEQGYISEDEKWIGISGNKGELREAFIVLEDMELLLPVKHTTPALRVFYKRFGLQPEERGVKGFISLRSLSDKSTTKDYEQLKKVLKQLKASRMKKTSISSVPSARK